MRVKRIHERVFLAVALVLFAAGILVAPDRYGDGNEYFLTLESLYGHLTPDLRGEDIMRYYTFERLPSTNSTVLVDAFGEPIPPTSGYVKNVQGNGMPSTFGVIP